MSKPVDSGFGNRPTTWENKGGPEGASTPHPALDKQHPPQKEVLTVATSLPSNTPVRLGADLDRALSQIDGCPDPDCPNVQPADAAIPFGDDWQIHFTCADCGTTWSQRWELP